MPKELFRLSGTRVWVAGHNGMVGSAIARRLRSEGCEILTVAKSQLDLRDPGKTRDWIETAKPDAIFLAAARAGGILANDMYPVDFLYENLMIEANVIEAAYRSKVKKLLFLGSSCIYPKMAPQPIPEGALLTGPLEPTNEWYAVAKIAGIKLCQAYRKQYGCDFISAMPTNIFGPGDNFDLGRSHVIPALIRKAHEAKINSEPSIVIWGSGRPRRELLYVDDCADACIFLMKAYSDFEHVNVGSGKDLEILELAQLVCDVVGFSGSIDHDLSKPDGVPRKLMSSDKIRKLGWSPKISLRNGLERTYQWYLASS